MRLLFGGQRQSIEFDVVEYTRTIAAVVALVLGLSNWPMGRTAAAQTSGVKTASLRVPGAVDRRVGNLPKPLSVHDADLYRQIFTLQKEGHWNEADARIKEIKDTLLLGHARFQRLMHPTLYRSSYGELWTWMNEYADHPGARRIYRLAKRRQPKGWKSPRPPGRAVLVSEVKSDPVPLRWRPRANGRSRATANAADLPRTRRRGFREVHKQIRSLVSGGYVTKALRFLEEPRHVRLLDAVGFDENLAWIAKGYFVRDRDHAALKVAGRAIARSGNRVPLAYWWGGLAAWRLGRHHVAGEFFRALAESMSVTPWLVSAGGYWASRAYLAAGESKRAVPMLRAAARHPRTFYGLLALTALGERPPLDFGMRRLSAADRDALLGMQPVRRALALVQVGEHVRAGTELRRFAHRLSPRMALVMLALASESRLADLSYRAAESLLQRTGVPVDAALYPLPVWEPDGGYTLDRAFLFAVMRQESSFRADARSPRGARGLMQLMPRTAGVMAGRKYHGAQRHELLEPVLSVTLGQKYLSHLLSREEIDGNLFYALTAYNSGPTKLREWQRRVDYRDDPLLFIESIPSSETRIFIERVLTNMWIYRFRFGQVPRSLETTVSGGWPAYVPLDRGRAAARS